MILVPATRADSAAIEHWLAFCVGVERLAFSCGQTVVYHLSGLRACDDSHTSY